MPLLGKIVVIKRQGGDGTEFPLTASCLFGRKIDCDIRIQLPQVSKEHCKIELNENKELILTNLSSVNPTRINGQVLNQSERLKHGDLITIIDRSFRFEYPPPKTPKKRLSTAGKDKAVKTLQDQQEKSTPIHTEKRKSEHSFDTCLKDGSNLPTSVDQSVETESEDGKIKKDSMSPFCELYQMFKQDLAAKSPWKSEMPKTPARIQVDNVGAPAADAITGPAVPKSSCNVSQEENHTGEMLSLGSITPSLTEKSVTPVSQKKRTPLKTPQKFSAGEVVQQVLVEPQPEVITPKSPKGRRSGASLTLQTPLDQPQTPAPMGKNTEVKMSPRTSPRSNAGKRFHVQDVQHEMEASTSKDKDGSSVNEVCDGNKATVSKAKRKRVSFGGQLSPELFDKRLPPDSPLCRGATPRRSLGPSQKSQSLLRRASTIGLMALRLKETVPESSTKKASPKRAGAKTPSPARRSPSTKAKTPSPKPQKSPSASPKASKTSSTPASPKTPSSARRASTSAVDAAGDTCTSRVQGRFSISRIKTPSPVQDQEENSEVQSIVVEDMPQKCVTPKIPLRRKSMKYSARKTPKSAIKSAFDVIRSRRSGASRANLKVLTSWADIVKFGQSVPQTDVTTKKKPTKSKVLKRTAVPKPKTPARRLKDEVSTGHAASPVSIVVGKAHVRTNQFCGAAPKIVNNMALYKKDMKMDEDFTGVADIFKTPANNKSKNVVPIIECPEMLVDEISVMKTPEESGEMIISPLSVRSTAKSGSYNSEAVTRLLLDDQDAVLSQLTDSSNEASGLDIIPDQEIPSNDQTEEEEEETEVKTPKWKASPSLYLTGVKRLMKTPKQRAEPIEDLRGKLLKTPKAYKSPQEDNLEGIKELLKTPNYKGAPVEDIVEEKRVMQTPKEKSLPVLCPASNQKLMETPKEKSEQHEELTAVKELLKTPKLEGDQEENQFCLKKSVKTPKQKRIQVEEDLTGVQQLMKTPKHKGEPVQDQMGIKRLMQTPKEKVEPVEYLTGVKRLMQTPKQKRESFSNEFGIGKLMMTPQHEGVMTEAAIAEFKELEEPENNCTLTTENGLTEPSEIQGPVPEVESDSALLPAKDFEECDKENVCPVETMEAEVDSQSITEIIDSIHSDVETDVVIPQEKTPDQIEESASVEDVDVCFSGTNDKSEEQSNESTSHNSIATVEATLISSTAEKEEGQIIKSSLANRIQRGGRGRATHKSKNADNEKVNIPAALSITEEEKMNDPLPSNPVRGRRDKKLLEAPEVAASPARKSARSKIPNYRFVDKEEKNSKASQVPVDSVKTEMPASLPVVTKTRRGRKAKQDDAKAAIEPVDDTSVCDPQCIDALANEELVQAPVVKLGQRQKMDKKGSLPSEKLEQKTSDVVCEENAVAPEGVKLLASLVTETVTATRPRRGIPAKNEQLKTEPTPTMENEITSTHAAVVAEKSLTPVAKSGRGRKAKKEIVKEQPCVAEVNVDEDKPETPVVKSGRGRKAKQQKPQIAEEVVDQPAEDASTCLSVTEEHTETVVKSVRGNRKTKQSKETVSIETEKNIVSLVEKSETPVVKAGRKRAVIAKETVVETEVSVKRGRRAVADPVPPVPVVSSRGRKVVAKAKVTENRDSSEQPSEPIKQTRRTAKVPETKREENPMTHAGSEVVAAENTAIVVAEKVGRGSRGRKQKDSSKDIPNNLVNEFSKAEKASEINPSKTVNWNPDLVTSKDIEEFEPSADVEPLKKSRRLGKVPAKTSSNQSTYLPPRGRRGAKKEEEPLIEEVQINIKPSRRGKAVGSAAPKSDPSDSKASAPLKRKHNDVLEVTDESPKKEPLPKKRGRVAISTKVAAEVSSKEKTPVTEPEKGEDNAKKTGNRAVRGQKKTTQEPDPAPTQESVSGTTTRRGRSVKKVEEVEISTEAAPVRRTRRK